jgi:alpha-ribazole phosphatase
MDLILIRHPKTVVPDGVCYGSSDVEPHPDHLARDAARIAPVLPKDARITASPQQRAQRLAAHFGTPETDPRLVEMDFGAWEMQRWDALPRAEIDSWADDLTGYTPPEGESLGAVAARVIDWWQDQPREGTLVAVAHGGPWRCLAAHLLGIPTEHSIRMEIEWGGRALFRVSDHGAQLRGWNLF